jgi:predicted GNAT family acetyltransferase
VTEFAAAVLPWLSQDPVRNNVVATVVDSRAAPGRPLAPEPVWLTVTADRPADALVGVAIRTPPRPLLLSQMPPSAAQALADWCVDEGLELPGVDGPAEASAAFCDRYTARRAVTAMPGLSMRMFQLDRVEWPAPQQGSARCATSSDRALLLDWSERFTREVSGESLDDPAMPIDKRLRDPAAQLIWLWEVDATPVSMCWLHLPVAGVNRISGVFTPPDLRGHGYASGCVAWASQHALNTGSHRCMLYTDLANPTSNKIYQAIGYRPVADAQQWRFA